MTGYSDASTATTLSSPRLPASPKRMFAPVSARPTPASNGQCRSEPRTGKRIARTNARPSGTAVTRIEKVAQIGLPLAAALRPTREDPNASAAISAKPTPAASRHAGSEVGEAPGEARPEREEDRAQGVGTGRVAATASSWFAW